MIPPELWMIGQLRAMPQTSSPKGANVFARTAPEHIVALRATMWGQVGGQTLRTLINAMKLNVFILLRCRCLMRNHRAEVLDESIGAAIWLATSQLAES
ncbi:hypothetical protein ACVJF2_001292 [Bradyrhizobium sp. USDA 4519]